MILSVAFISASTSFVMSSWPNMSVETNHLGSTESSLPEELEQNSVNEKCSGEKLPRLQGP